MITARIHTAQELPNRVDYLALRRLRIRHKLALGILICSFTFVFGGFVLPFVVPAALGVVLTWLTEVGFGLAILLCIWGFFFGKTPCPRCGKPYYVAEGLLGYFCKIELSRRKCVHCDLPLETKEEPMGG